MARAAVLTLLALAALPGCGGSGDDEPGGTTMTPDSRSTATTPEPPKLTPEAARVRRRIMHVQRVLAGRVAPDDRAAAVAELQAAVAKEARRRQRSGELRRRPVARRVVCEPLEEGRRGPVRAPSGELLLECIAVTSEAYSRAMRATVRLGFEFRARVNLDTGAYGFCSIEVPPAEGGSDISGSVPLSPRCGG
jgi:hypothetical protein